MWAPRLIIHMVIQRRNKLYTPGGIFNCLWLNKKRIQLTIVYTKSNGEKCFNIFWKLFITTLKIIDYDLAEAKYFSLCISKHQSQINNA